MTVILDDLETDDDPPPKLIGRCSIVPSSSASPCGRKIYESDYYEELERGKGLVCEPCIDRLLSPKVIVEEPEKNKNKSKKGSTRTGARLSQGPQGRLKESK